MKQTILFIALLFSFNIIFADNTPDTNKTDAFLVGHVISNGSHISNVIINIMGTNITTTTNYTGHYEIPNAPVGQLTIIAQSMGFLSQEKIININSNQTIELNFELQSDLINLDQVVVSSDKTDRNRAQDPVLVNVISPKLFASTGAVCSAEILNFQPGLRIENNCQNCGFNQLRINGMEGHYTQILINSRPIFSALNGVYGLEQIPAQMIDRIEIVRGGGSALFGGNAIAGTVNIITKDPVNNSFQLNSTFSAINGNTPDYNLGFNTSVVSDDLKSGLFIFGIKRSRNAFFANEDDFSELPLIKSNSFGFSAFYKITSQIKISADFHNLSEFRRGGNKFDYMPHLADIAEQVDHDINGGGVNFDFLSKNYNSKFSAFISGQITYRQSYYGAELNPAAYGNTNDVSVVSGLQFSHNFKDVFFIPIKIVGGVENIRTSLIDKKLAYVDDDNILQPERIIVNQQLNTKGAFIQSEINYDKIKIMLGARYDIPDDNLQIQPVFMPRLNLLVNIIKQSKIRLSFARGYRAPQVFDEDLHIETSAARQVIHLNSEDLTAEFSNSFSGSIDYVLYKNDVQIYFLADFFYTILQNPFANEFVFNENDKILTSYRTNSESGAYVQGV
ncbi:MAG: TonB-dependent receptor, partial [Bacteroidales bacterium]|nr:TonB-dependent receptor [Bacteroidales bacterium]